MQWDHSVTHRLMEALSVARHRQSVAVPPDIGRTLHIRVAGLRSVARCYGLVEDYS